MKYEKPPKTIDEQIEILKKRGLIVNDEDEMRRYLKNISYYHLSIYFKHFQKDNFFIKGVEFDDVLNIYIFDQKLRLLLLDVLERIEKSFKCRLAYEMSVSSGDSCWIADSCYFKNKVKHDNRIVGLLEKLRDSKETYIKHFYEKYSSPEYPPIWMIIEALTFGQSVVVYGMLKKENQKIIADTYGLNKKFVFNWLHALSIIRNFCAHHSRLWNREMVIILSQKHGLYRNLFDNSNGNRLFNYLIVMQIINCKFNPDSKWLDRMEVIINEHKINISHMGFPEDWRDRLRKIKEVGVN
ncbi:Abi family protein [Patescibacteria group bacterium]